MWRILLALVFVFSAIGDDGFDLEDSACRCCVLELGACGLGTDVCPFGVGSIPLQLPLLPSDEGFKIVLGVEELRSKRELQDITLLDQQPGFRRGGRPLLSSLNLNRQEVYSRLHRKKSRPRARDPGTGARKACATRLLKECDHWPTE